MIRVSVIIPTRNRFSLLKKTLESIVSQTLNKALFELIIIDNGSTDSTKIVAEEFREHLIHFRYVYDANPGLHIGRNLGYQLSKGDILVYADDDIQAYSTWLEAILDSFEDYDVGMVGGNNLPLYEREPPSWVESLFKKNDYGIFLAQLSLLDFGNESKEIHPNFIWGCNFSIRKQILEDMKGFHPDGMPEESIFYRGDGESYVTNSFQKTNYKAVFNPKASVTHYVPVSRLKLEYLYKRSYSQGISDSYTKIRENKSIYYGDVLEAKLMSQNEKRNSKIKIEHEQVIIQGYWNGYLDHHYQVYKNNGLLQWVLQEDYLGKSGHIKRN